MRKKKILLLDTGKEWGGGTNSMIELLKRIDRNQFEIHCLFYTDYSKGQGALLSTILKEIDIPFSTLPPLPQPAWAKWGKELVRGFLMPFPTFRQAAVNAIETAWRIQPRSKQIAECLKAGQFDALYMNNQPESNREGYLAGAILNLPVIQHCRLIQHSAKSTGLSTQAITLASQAAMIIAVSQGIADFLKHVGVQKVPIQVVKNGIDIHQPILSQEEARKQLNLPTHQLITVCVAALLPRKSVHHLIEALEAVPDMTLYCLGEGSERARLSHLATEKGVSERVHLVGFSEHPLTWVAASDIVALASESEGLPRTLLEGMLCGKPILASDVTGSHDVVDHGKTGFLFPYGDIEQLKQYWKQLTEDAELRQQLGSASLKRVQEEFSIEAYVKGVEHALHQAFEPQGQSCFI